MELKTFISSTLAQIAQGVKDSQSVYHDLGGVVNPNGLKLVAGSIAYGKTEPMHGTAVLLCNVEFEVSLTEDNSQGTSGGIGVLFGALTIGGKADASDKRISLNRVKFNIPVKLPSE